MICTPPSQVLPLYLYIVRGLLFFLHLKFVLGVLWRVRVITRLISPAQILILWQLPEENSNHESGIVRCQKENCPTGCLPIILGDKSCCSSLNFFLIYQYLFV